MGSPFCISVLGFAAIILLQQFNPSYSLPCKAQNFSGNRKFQLCVDLPHLNAYIHWNYNVSNSTLSMAFAAPPDDGHSFGWVGWAINPYSKGMIGSQAFLAISADEVVVKTYNISSYELVPSKIDFEVLNMEAEYDVDLSMMRIYATLILPKNLGTVVNHVWQAGPMVRRDILPKHAFGSANMNSMGKLDLVKGKNIPHGATEEELKHKYMHGILNTLSWGFLLPVGVITARYLRAVDSLDPTWFKLHVSCQVIGYILGVAGWGTGMKLGHENGIKYILHRVIGIALFCLCTMQVFASFLRPKKDHKFLELWNCYHRTQGYIIVILGIVNVFKGLKILNPASKWRNSYEYLFYILLGVAILAEVVKWTVIYKKRSPRPVNP